VTLLQSAHRFGQRGQQAHDALRRIRHVQTLLAIVEHRDRHRGLKDGQKRKNDKGQSLPKDATKLSHAALPTG
jgi:hypothetical protein